MDEDLEKEELQLIQISDTVYATKEELEQSEQAAELLQSLQESLSPVKAFGALLSQ